MNSKTLLVLASSLFAGALAQAADRVPGDGTCPYPTKGCGGMPQTSEAPPASTETSAPDVEARRNGEGWMVNGSEGRASFGEDDDDGE